MRVVAGCPEEDAKFFRVNLNWEQKLVLMFVLLAFPKISGQVHII
jgi:hypothetical protein